MYDKLHILKNFMNKIGEENSALKIDFIIKKSYHRGSKMDEQKAKVLSKAFEVWEENPGPSDKAIAEILNEKYNLSAKIHQNDVRKITKEYNGKKDYVSVLKNLNDNLSSITFETAEKNEDIKAEMIREIKKLAQL